MGKLGKKARKFAKKNLQSVEKRSRKLKPFIKKKFAKRNERHQAGDKQEKKVEQQPKKRCQEEEFQDIAIDAVFGKDDDEVLRDGDSDSDGYLDELVNETDSDIMKCKVLSRSFLATCCDMVDKEQYVPALVRLLNWYRAACQYGHEPSGIARPNIYYDIEDSETFAKVIIFVLQKADHTFRSILGLSDSSTKEKILKLKNNPKWDSLKPLVKSFFRSTLHLVKQAGDLEIISFTLTQLRVSIVFLAAFPDLLKKLIKISVHLWVTGEETISQQAFLILKDISMVFNSECFDSCLINMYKAFLHDCDIPKANSEQRPFLRDSLVELCSQDVQKSYTKASVSITQLAKLLKMALATKNKEAVEKIHSGEYINCVDLWVNFISANVQDCDLQPLLYTIVQVINGVAQLIIGPRYLLLRVKCIHWLNHLSRTSGIFIPIASLVLDMLEYKTTNDGEKQEQKLEAVSTVKLPKNWLKSQNFQEQCIFSVIELLAVHFAQWSFHISFPDLATIPVMRLKKFHERSTMEGLKRVVKRFIEQVESNIEFVQRKRDDVTFSPNDQQSADTFMQLEKQNANAPYTQYYQSIIDKAEKQFGETMAVEDTPKSVVTEEAKPNSIENPIDRYHEEGDDAEEGEIAGGEGDGNVDESSKSGVPESHPLEHSWTFWFDNPAVKSKQTSWGSSLRPVFTFSTVEEFWSLYNNMKHPSKLAHGADFYCFKHIIEPKWEDPICANGGKWTMTFPKEKSDKSWLYTLLALIGEQFDHGDEICGAVVNIRGKQERISIWTKNASNEAAQVSIGKQWKEFLDYNNSIGFIIHEDAKKLDRNAKNAYTA